QAGDGFHVRLVHLLQELARVGGQTLYVATLSFGVERIEGEAALAGARRTGDYDQAIAREIAIDALEVVHSGPADRNRVWLGPHSTSRKGHLSKSGRFRVGA